MTREQAKKILELLPVIKAFADGKDIEYEYPEDCWVKVTIPFFDNSLNWRVAPEPLPKKLREWKPKEVPLDAWYTSKTDASRAMHKTQFTYMSNGQRYIILRDTDYSTNDLLRHWMHSLNQGKTWFPCGVEE